MTGDWRQSTLGEVARWGSGGTPQAGNSAYYGGDIPWAVIGDLNDAVVSRTAASITEEGLRRSSAKLVPAGAVLVAMYGSIGKLGVAGVRMATNQAIAFALPHEFVDRDFLFYYLLSQRHELDGAGKGATQRNIGQAILKAWPIRYPSLLQQRRMVAILEEHLSDLDAARRSLESAVARLERLATVSLWSSTHGVEGSRRVTLDEIAEVRLGRQRSPKNHSGPRMRPYLRAANVDWDRLRLDDVSEMNFTEAEERIYRLVPGDILLAEASGSAAEVGKSVIYEGKPSSVCFQNTLLRVRCHAAQPEFVQKYLLAEARAGRFMPESRGVGINHLGRARLAGLVVDLPNEAVQREAAQCVEELLDRLSRTEQAVRSELSRAASLRRAVLAAAFSGRLTGRASDTEVISELAEEEYA